MGIVDGLRHSGLARRGLLALVGLAYLVYVSGTVLAAGVDGLLADPPVLELLGATGLVVLAIWLAGAFFVVEPASDAEE